MGRLRALWLCVAVAGCAADELTFDETTQSVLTPLPNPPASALFAPADYDGDGLTDLAVKANNVWYIDVAQCVDPELPNLLGKPETTCFNYVDDDNDGLINDGCPAVGLSEPQAVACADALDNDGDSRVNDGCPAVGAAETACADAVDDDGDGAVNDGCAAVGAAELDLSVCARLWGTVKDEDNDGYIDDGCPANTGCLGPNGFGASRAWDFAYEGYGDNTALPIPADYGSTGGGPADGKADLAIKDATGMFAIDYADNGFGNFDEVHLGYGGSEVTPIPADYDGDGKTDFAIWTTHNGTTYGELYFDYSSNGFGGWDLPCGGCPCVATRGFGYVGGYGSAGDIPAVGKFDADQCADFSIKTNGGYWYFDLTATGFGWDSPCPGCAIPLAGYGSSAYEPIVADYDGDGRTDLAVKTPDGYWSIDYAADGFGAWNIWPFMRADWGGGSATFRAGHYINKTGSLDLGIKDPYGNFYVDAASTGYGTLDIATSFTSRVNVDTQHPYISETTVSTNVPASSCNGLSCDAGEDCVTCPRDCGACPDGGNYHERPIAPTDLKVGVRYTANVLVQPGSSYDDSVSVMANPNVRVPPELNVENLGGHVTTLVPAPLLGAPAMRRLGFMCSKPGFFPLGFTLNRDYEWSPINPDFGIWVRCTADQPGLYGTVTDKATSRGIVGAVVKVNGVQVTPNTDSAGRWYAPQYTSGPYTIEVTAPGYSPATAVNVRVTEGMQVDTPLETGIVLPTGITYTTYIDYSRGRTILHTVAIDVTRAPITIGKTTSDPSCSWDQYGCGGCGGGEYSDFRRLVDVATAQNAPVMMNGIWWMLDGTVVEPDGTTHGKNWVQTGNQVCGFAYGAPAQLTRAIGYLYINGYVPTEWGTATCTNGVCRPSEVECANQEYYAAPKAGRAAAPRVRIQDAWQSPMFTVAGSGTQQVAKVIMTPSNFLTSSAPWKRVSANNVPGCPSGNTCPIYDAAAPTNQSDFNYAFQMGVALLRDAGKACTNNASCGTGETCTNKKCDGLVIARGVAAQYIQGEYAIARTSVGTSVDGKKAWFVVADGEGIDGGNGATFNELGQFYRDVLGASDAMWVDSGESTELVLKTAFGQRTVNTVTSENNSADGVGPVNDYCPSGRVFAYIKAGS